jgi:DNA-binding MarR family transcriptional regulator
VPRVARCYSESVTGAEGAKGDGCPPARLTYLVKQLERAIRVAMEEITSEFGLTPIQYTALSVLMRNPGMSSAQLARRSFVSPQACYEMVVVLERNGLVTRRPTTANRRILSIRVTRSGGTVLKQCDRRMDALEERVFASLGPTARKNFRDALTHCVSSLYPEIRRTL